MRVLAVLVHYDRDGLVARHVRYALRQLRPADRLVFVTAGRLADDVPLADEVIERENSGYDFGSWRDGLRSVPRWWDYDRVVLVNDSVVGPLLALPDLLSHQHAPAFGITISEQYVPHLQSYFMSFDRQAAGNPFFRAFWAGMPAIDDREQVIDAYELGLARLLRDLGVPLGAYFTPNPLERRIGAARNLRAEARRPLLAGAYGALRPTAFSPVHMLWDRALTGALPAVKVAHFTRPTRSRGQLRRDLRRLRRAHPAAFDGFEDYLARVAA